MDRELLNIVGFGHHTSHDYAPKKVVLRGGRETVVWVHKGTGHGILDPENWFQEGYYGEEYRKEFTGDAKGHHISPSEHLKMFRDLNKKQFEKFSHALGPATSYLEVGCSFGGVLDLVVNHGVGTYEVVEPNVQDANYVKDRYPNAKVQNLLLEDADLQPESYDVIVSFEVLEHTVSPTDFLLKLHRSLKRHGAIYLEVPNHDDALLSCYDGDITYNNFYYHKAHIHYFTLESLTELCHECGFDGIAESFLMYPFFNHVYWHFNKGPQPTARQALSLPVPTDGVSAAQLDINLFYERVEKEYEELLNKNKVGDCIFFRGTKQ